MVTMKKSVTMEAVKSLLLEWDGDGSGLEAVETAGGTLYKAADVIIQNEDIPGMTVTDNEGKETLVTDSIYNDMISRSLVGEGFAAKVAGLVWIAQKEAQAPGAKLPAGGIWLLKKQDGSYPEKVVLPAYREAFLQGEKPDGEQGESMGGVKSWNDLTDRPFEDTRKVEEIKIEWDGNTDGLVTGEEGWAYKVSDLTPSFDELQFASVTMIIDGEPVAFNAPYKKDNEFLGDDGFVLMHDETGYMPVVVIHTPTEFYPETGIYFTKTVGDDGQVDITTSLTYTGVTGEIKTIDPKFLPEGVGEVPFFDLVEMGLPVVTVGKMVNAEIDTTPIVSAAEKTPVRIRIRADLYNDGSVMEFYKIINLCAIPVAGAAVTGENLFSDVIGGDGEIASADIFVLDLVFNPSGVRAAVIRQTII